MLRRAALLRSIRMGRGQINPAPVTPHKGTTIENLRAFLREIHAHKNALALPHQAPALRQPFRAFKFLRGYQCRLLKRSTANGLRTAVPYSSVAMRTKVRSTTLRCAPPNNMVMSS